MRREVLWCCACRASLQPPLCPCPQQLLPPEDTETTDLSIIVDQFIYPYIYPWFQPPTSYKQHDAHHQHLTDSPMAAPDSKEKWGYKGTSLVLTHSPGRQVCQFKIWIWKRSIRWISMFVVHIQACLILRSEITQQPSWPITTYWYHCFLDSLPAIPSPTIPFIKRDLFQHRLTNQHSQRPTTQSSIKPSTCSIILYGRLKEVTNCHCIDIEDARPGGEVLSLTHPTNQLAAPSSPHPSHPP